MYYRKPTPKLDTIALNIQTTVTTISYLNLPFVSFVKYCPVADVRPIEVVKQARPTITARIILPGWPSSILVIFTINDV